MKKYLYFLSVVCLSVFGTIGLNGQCVPDETCEDINEPGEFCPITIPNAQVGVLFEQVITVIPPDSAEVAPGSKIKIEYIRIDSVKNFPPGINYTKYDEYFYPDTSYCIDLAGTPTQGGSYNLKVYVTPFIFLINDIYPTTQVVNDTSLIMVVEGGTWIDPFATREFHLLGNSPNPFIHQTRIGFFTPVDQVVTLKVYTLLGDEIYTESVMAVHGENYFNFSGAELGPGIYFYGIRNSEERYTGKFIKLE